MVGPKMGHSLDHQLCPIGVWRDGTIACGECLQSERKGVLNTAVPRMRPNPSQNRPTVSCPNASGGCAAIVS